MWILRRLADAGLVKGKTVGIDATTLKANAALRSIVRRDTGESYQDFLTKLAQASGIETATRADLERIDRKRKKRTPDNFLPSASVHVVEYRTGWIPYMLKSITEETVVYVRGVPPAASSL